MDRDASHTAPEPSHTDGPSAAPPSDRPRGSHQRPRALGAAVIVAAIVLAGGMTAGLFAVGNGLAMRGVEGVTVTGSARVDVDADRAVWVISAFDQADDVATAVRGTEASLAAVQRYLTDGGLSPDDVTLEALSTNTNYVWIEGSQSSEISSYSAYRSLRIRSDDVQLIDRLSRDFGTVLVGGVSANAWAPEYYVTTLPELRPELLEQAVADALVRAEAMLRVTGGEVDGVRSVRSGPFQVSAPDSVDVSDYGMYDTSTIRKTVTATVTVTLSTR
jgi:uncharacterized protein